MKEKTGNEETGKNQKKNQKNIYVHKINSLMKLSRDNLIDEDKEISQNVDK
jgi:hypothetical protein